MRKILVCGSRTWADEVMIERVLSRLEGGGLVSCGDGGSRRVKWVPTIIHGDARGADRLAGKIAEDLGYPCKAFPADWDKHGKKAGPIRNSEMLKEKGISFVIAFAYDLWNSVGTLDMVNKSLKKGLPVYWYPYGLLLTKPLKKK